MKTRIDNERGIALVVVLLVGLAVGTISVGAAMLSSNATAINSYSDRLNLLEAAADAAIQEVRTRVNNDPNLYPDDGYVAAENGVAVTDAGGTVIPNVTRWTYVGPTGLTSGQYGVYGSIVTIVEDTFGNRVVRRGEIVQESFARYAYFTDYEPSNISFGGGDQIQGPVHTNDYLKIYPSGATFLGQVRTAKTVQGSQYGTFAEGYTEYAPRINMPQTADLTKLSVQASAGGTKFIGSTNGGTGRATTRVEFVALDLDGDGLVTGDNEGFIKVYQANNQNTTGARWVTGDLPGDYGANRMRNSLNCGHFEGATFVTADAHPTGGADNWVNAMVSPTRQCFLGGNDFLNGGPGGTFVANDGLGSYIAWTGPINPLVAARPDAQYLIPINREMNPTFKGVIYVEGKVAVSGVIRGQITLAATNDIILADDFTYATNPGAGTCQDILGLFAADDIMVADNTINAPVVPAGGFNYFSYDDTTDEFFHGVLLALDIFTVDYYYGGARTTEPCGPTAWGRGCLYLTGGIIQRTRGAVGTGAGTGYLKRYSYDQCAMNTAPPYFPTTGHFISGRYYNVDPVGFNLSSYWTMLTPQ